MPAGGVPSLGMATIALARGEGFAHRHDTSSTTRLVRGDALLRIEQDEVPLERGVSVPVPAGALHEVVAGSDDVVFECFHTDRVIEDPPDP